MEHYATRRRLIFVRILIGTIWYALKANICAYSVWNLLHVTLLAPRNLRCLLNFLKIYSPLSDTIPRCKIYGDSFICFGKKNIYIYLIILNFKAHEQQVIQRQIKRHTGMQSDSLNKASSNAGICEALLVSNSV